MYIANGDCDLFNNNEECGERTAAGTMKRSRGHDPLTTFRTATAVIPEINPGVIWCLSTTLPYDWSL